MLLIQQISDLSASLINKKRNEEIKSQQKKSVQQDESNWLCYSQVILF
jgi:hypothetical protein